MLKTAWALQYVFFIPPYVYSLLAGAERWHGMKSLPNALMHTF